MKRAITDLTKNLCDECSRHPATCPAIGVVYGLGKGRDNVIKCKTFSNLESQKEESECS
jgi:hypothetical protein